MVVVLEERQERSIRGVLPKTFSLILSQEYPGIISRACCGHCVEAVVWMGHSNSDRC